MHLENSLYYKQYFMYHRSKTTAYKARAQEAAMSTVKNDSVLPAIIT